MKLEEATAYTEKCFNGDPASCTCACPFHMDIRSFINKVGNRKWKAAYRILRDATVFPKIVSTLCDQPCQSHCQRTQLNDQPIALRELEVACLKYSKQRKPEAYAIASKTQSIAIVGAGVAGLSCALNLAQKKYTVKVFEKESGWGGTLRTHSRFQEFDQELALQFSVHNVEFSFDTTIKTLAELEEFDAVYIATGSKGDDFGLLQSWDPNLFTTSVPKIFLGGMLCGATLMEGIAQGKEASKIIEVYLQTGNPTIPYGNLNSYNCVRYLQHDGAVSVPRVQPSSADGYSEDEAQEEANRCLLCDCNNCMVACEVLKHFRKAPHKIAVEVYNDSQVNPPFSTCSITRQTYSCNICGYCKSVCPEGVDIGALLQFSRTERMNGGNYPAALHDFWLREMDFAVSEASFASAPKGKQTCEYAFFPGCQLGASNPEYVRKGYDFLSQNFDAGLFLDCCGAPAYWAGDDKRLRSNLEKMKQHWLKLGEPTLIFACATCQSIFRKFLPEIKRVSLYELLAETEGISFDSPFSKAAVFDPCASRGNDEMQSGVRTLAKQAGITVEELRERNRCCGYGGHMRTANPTLYDEITHNRAEASDKPYIVYCANCREVFASRGKECAHILDLVFGLQSGLEVPNLQQKRENSLNLKKDLLKSKWDMDFEPERQPWDELTLIINQEIQKSMDQKLITAADLKEAIWLAEGSGDKFYDDSDGMCLCSMVKPVVTYWVQYKETSPGVYEIFSAYSHRIRFNEGE